MVILNCKNLKPSWVHQPPKVKKLFDRVIKLKSEKAQKNSAKKRWNLLLSFIYSTSTQKKKYFGDDFFFVRAAFWWCWVIKISWKNMHKHTWTFSTMIFLILHTHSGALIGRDSYSKIHETTRSRENTMLKLTILIFSHSKKKLKYWIMAFENKKQSLKSDTS